MAIIFGSDAGIREDYLAESFTDFVGGEFNRIRNGMMDNFARVTGESAQAPPAPPAERVYVDDGFSNVPGTSFVGSTIDNIDDVQRRRVTTQEPHLTVYIKKRAFWSLRQENDPKLMDSGEKLLIRATKKLFERKCTQLGAYEGMTKLSKLVTEDAHIDAANADVLIEYLTIVRDSTTDGLNSETSLLLNSASLPQDIKEQRVANLIRTVNNINEDYNAIIEKLSEVSRKQHSLRSATTTTWVVDPDDKDVSQLGRGTGVIELTAVSQISTSLSIDGSSSVSFTIQDPYNLCKITTDDVESSLGAAFEEQSLLNQPDGGGPGFQDMIARGPGTWLDEARRKEEKLKSLRRDKLVGQTFGLPIATSQLRNSEGAEIVFEINPTSSAENKITASVSNFPDPFTKDNYRIILQGLPPAEAINEEEDKLISEIFELLEKYVVAVEILNGTVLDNNGNPDVEYARRTLRKFYLGKDIVQPMDGVHVFIRGNTAKPDENIGPLSQLLNGTDYIKKFSNDHGVVDSVLEEELRQFGMEDLPLAVYKSIRTSSFMRNAGIQVFGGLISSVSEEYSEGMYTTKVNGESNMKWLTLSRVNKSPALDQSQGLLEDPLTPYDLSEATDPATGLLVKAPPFLKVNEERCKAKILRYTTGPRAGELVCNENLTADYKDDGEGGVQPVQQHAPGVVYRWKEGVLTATRNVNLQTSLSGAKNQSDKLRREVGVLSTETPFAGQDAADTVSLLVTGVPHNYETFVANAKSAGNFVPGVDNAAGDYFHSFFDITRSTNKALGNFRPFKTFEITPEERAKRLLLQTSLQENNEKINDLRSEIVKFQDELNRFIPINDAEAITIEKLGAENEINSKDLNKRSLAEETLNSIIKGLKDRLKTEQKEMTAKIADGAKTSGLRVYGNDVAIEFDTSNVDNKEVVARNENQRLSNKLLQLRTQFDCKFNQDSNLFIVADDYDKDLDIQAFVLKLSKKRNTWDAHGDYSMPKDICVNVAKTLNFEFFCDTQGHIRFRPPRYNRTPLSLMLKMFMLDDRENKKLFPPFLNSLFANKQQSLEEELEIVNAEIDILLVLLNVTKPRETFVQERSVDPNITTVSKILPSETIKSTAKNLIVVRNDLARLTGGSTLDPLDATAILGAEIDIRKLNDPRELNLNVARQTKFAKVSQLISKRQKIDDSIVKLKARGVFIDGTDRILPETGEELRVSFGSTIEDDLVDFLGPGAASRFIIYDDQIINYSFTEDERNAQCRVNVTGEEDLTGDAKGQLGKIPVIFAGATDFDMWRQYGYRGGVLDESKPFFKDAESQCAPYALFLLNRARRDVVRGSVTLYGNEFYQLGDVVYINSRDMLYYVESVSHDFSYSGDGSFTTTLSLRYGHPLGDYIPTPLDVIGKNVVKNQKKFNNTVTTRTTASRKLGVHMGIVIFPKTASSGNADADEEPTDPKAEMLGGPYKRLNIKKLKNALTLAKHQLGESTPNSYPKLEIRGYSRGSDDTGEGTVVAQERMSVVREWFLNPVGRKFEEEGVSGYITLSDQFSGISENQIRDIDPTYDPVDLTVDLEGRNKVEVRLPKEEVHNAVNKIDTDYDSIIEIVLVFE